MDSAILMGILYYTFSGIISIAESAISAFLILLFSLIYYNLVSGFLSDVTLRRITKASFDINVFCFIDLFISYSLAIMSFLIIYFYKTSIDSTFLINETLLVMSGFGLLFIGRILAKKQGSIYGKMHFSALFIIVSLILLVQLITVVPSNDWSWNLIRTSMGNYFSLIDRHKPLIVVGSILLSSFGEFILSSSSPGERSWFSVSEKFPAGLRVITGIKPIISNCEIINSEIKEESKVVVLDGWRNIKIVGSLYTLLYSIIFYYRFCIRSSKETEFNHKYNSPIRSKLRELFLDSNIQQVKCVSRTLTLAVDILDLISPQIGNGTNIGCKILIPSESDAIREYERMIRNRRFTVSYAVMNLEDDRELFKKTYKERLNKLLESPFEVREYNFGELSFIISDNKSGNKNILFPIRDKGPMMRRVGLCSDQPYTVDLFSIIFDNAWKDARVLKEISNEFT